MKKKIKKKIIMIGILLATCVAMLLVFIVKRSQKKGFTINKMYNWMGTYWINEKGMFQFSGEHLTFANPESGNQVVACGKTGCDHAGSDCPAYFKGLVSGITCDSEGMLFLAHNDTKRSDTVTLYQADEVGENRKEIHEFERVTDILNVVYDAQSVYVSYTNYFDENGNELDLPEVGIVSYDIKEKKETRIFNDSKINPYIMAVTVYDEDVYFTYAHSSMTKSEALKHADDSDYALERQKFELRKISAEGGGSEVIFDDLSALNYIPIVDDNLYVCKKDGVYKYNVTGKTSEKILEGEMETIPTYTDGKEQVLIRCHEDISNQENDLVEDNRKVKYFYYKDDKFEELFNQYVCIAVIGKYTYFFDEEAVLHCGETENFLNENDEEIKKFHDKVLGG